MGLTSVGLNERLPGVLHQAQVFVNGDFVVTKHKPLYICVGRVCHSKSGDTEKVSYHGYKNCPHHFLSEALYNPFPFPVLYFILVIFYYYYYFNVFICLFVCPRAGFLAGAALIGLLFPFPLIHSRNIRVRDFEY